MGTDLTFTNQTPLSMHGVLFLTTSSDGEDLLILLRANSVDRSVTVVTPIKNEPETV
jgi:hypothetical protein